MYAVDDELRVVGFEAFNLTCEDIEADDWITFCDEPTPITYSVFVEPRPEPCPVVTVTSKHSSGGKRRPRYSARR